MNKFIKLWYEFLKNSKLQHTNIKNLNILKILKVITFEEPKIIMNCK